MGAAKYLECFTAFLMAFVALVLFWYPVRGLRYDHAKLKTLVCINSLRAEALRTDWDLHYA